MIMPPHKSCDAKRAPEIGRTELESRRKQSVIVLLEGKISDAWTTIQTNMHSLNVFYHASLK